jgi:hypothetical protein
VIKAPETSGPADAITVQSPDGAIAYRLRVTQWGLCVQRERRHCDKAARLVQTTVFHDHAGFERWCASDEVRFSHPVVMSTLQRRGNALLGLLHSQDAARTCSGQ